MNCPHTDRPNVMMPPLAPKCHECHYAAQQARTGWQAPLTAYKGKREAWEESVRDFATDGRPLLMPTGHGWISYEQYVREEA